MKKPLSKKFLLLSPHELIGEVRDVEKSLLDSLRIDGQASPLLVCGKTPPYKVIDGHKRLIVLTELGIPVECLHIDDPSLEETVEQAIRCNAHRGLTMLEKANMIASLLRSGMNEERVFHEYLRKLKLPQEKLTLDNLLKVAELPEVEKSLFDTRNFGEYLLTLIFNLGDSERSLFLRFAGTFSLNHNQARDVLEKLRQIGGRRNMSEILSPLLERIESEPGKSSLFLKSFLAELDLLCNQESETWRKLGEIRETLPKNLVIDEREYLRNGVLSFTVRLKGKGDVDALVDSLSGVKGRV